MMTERKKVYLTTHEQIQEALFQDASLNFASVQDKNKVFYECCFNKKILIDIGKNKIYYVAEKAVGAEKKASEMKIRAFAKSFLTYFNTLKLPARKILIDANHGNVI
jgi:hypothetical protein